MPNLSRGVAVSLNAATGTGAGTSVAVPYDVSDTASIGVWQTTTGTPTTATTTIQFSCDNGTTWFNHGTTLSTNGATNTGMAVYQAPPGATHVRANLTTLSGGTAPTVTTQIGVRTVTG